MVEVTRTERGLSATVQVPVEYELVVLRGGTVTRRRLPTAGVVTVGRGDEASVVVDDQKVSRVHLAVHCSDGIYVEDLGSRNGTFLGPERLAAGRRVRLGAGEVVLLGTTTMMVQLSLEPEPPWEPEQLRAALARAEEWTLLSIETPQVKDRLGLWRAVRSQLASNEGFAHHHGRLEIALSTRAGAEQVLGALLPALRDCAELGPITVGSSARPSSLEHGEPLRWSSAPAMRAVVDQLSRAAKSELPVVLLGETGAGKDVCARFLHQASGRAGPLFSVNCGALSENLLESELFGHERGAFTGAVAAKPGLLEAAAGGTFFFDEVGELPLSLQAKLLHVLERGEVRRVGAVKPVRLDVRFVAATNRDLEAEVRARRFREDLYFRLAAVTVRVPPLRERPADIEPLARQFLAGAAERAHQPARPLSDDALAALRTYPWPGNVRQLKNVVEAAAVMARGTVVTAADLHLPPTPRLSLSGPLSTLDEDDQRERDRVLDALERAAGNQSEAARQLGISRSTLVQRLEKYGLPRPRKPRPGAE